MSSCLWIWILARQIIRTCIHEIIKQTPSNTNLRITYCEKLTKLKITSVINNAETAKAIILLFFKKVLSDNYTKLNY